MADDFREIFNNTTARDRNRVAQMVSAKVTKEDADLKNLYEEQYFDSLVAEAEAHQIKYGFWPTFEMEELDYDDFPDIYSNTAEEWHKERHKGSVESEGK